MEFHLVEKLFRQSLRTLASLYRCDPREARYAAAGACWLAMAMLDHGRPVDWIRSDARLHFVGKLNEIENNFVEEIELAADDALVR